MKERMKMHDGLGIINHEVYMVFSSFNFFSNLGGDRA